MESGWADGFEDPLELGGLEGAGDPPSRDARLGGNGTIGAGFVEAGDGLDFARGRALETLEAHGHLPPRDSGAYASLAYETVNNGNGWYYHHHHHLHVSLYGGAGKPGFKSSGPQHIDPTLHWNE